MALGVDAPVYGPFVRLPYKRYGGPVLQGESHFLSTVCQESDFRRQRACFIAALNVLDGTVLARCAPRKRHTEFLAFLKQLHLSVPRGREIHLILDNYATHTHPKVDAWFAAHPRYHRHFVPTSSSWLNLIERWFAEITRKRIRRGTFRSVPALIQAIDDYVSHHNRHATPFLWTKSAETILRKVRHCKEALKTGH